MKIDFCGYTDTGAVREINQDSILMRCKDDVGIFVVADGMGGHSFGEKASAIIVQQMEKWWRGFVKTDMNREFHEVIEEIRMCLEQANYEIYSNYNVSGVCGSTVVALFVYKDKCCYFTSGDSRIYRLKGWKFEQISFDDVWENQDSVMQAFTKEQRQKHPNHGKLLNAVGISSELKIRVMPEEFAKKQKFLLCSDGIYKMIPDKSIKKLLRSYKGNKNGLILLDKIKEKVLASGARDNFSIILLKCYE